MAETKKTKEDKPKKKVSKSKDSKYVEAIGRRKNAVARVRVWVKGKKEFLVNGKSFEDYFTNEALREKAKSSLSKMNCLDKFKISVLVKGGGISAQAEAIRHGIARFLVASNPDFKKRLKKAGFLTRDPRMRERKKFGLKRARRAPQWRKR
jgi:small subunit ribosomal protein S9